MGGKSRREFLKQQFADGDIKILSYNGGMIIKAGEWPELGRVEKETNPELYVRVNQVLRTIRTSSLISFHLGSNAGEIRMNEILTAEWMKRFDVDFPATRPVALPLNPKRISAKSGDICPCSGRWVILAGGHHEFVEIQVGAIMPEATKYQSNMYAPEVRIPAIWNLLNRDDGESVYTDAEDN